jgi:hypothetical protein
MSKNSINPTDKIIHTFPVLYQGWECDATGWVMERRDGSRYIKMTNHGGEYVADVIRLENKISEYNNAILATKKAIELATKKV